MYLRSDDDWAKAGKESAYYSCALENLCATQGGKAVTVRECLAYQGPVASSRCGYLAVIPAGEEITVLWRGEYGVKDGVLFPIYYLDNYEFDGAYIRGIDITGALDVSKVSDGKGGKMTLYQQRALTGINMGEYGFSKEKIDEALSHDTVYEIAGLRGGLKLFSATFCDSDSKAYDLDLETSGWLSLLYPLNMENPVPIVEDYRFSGGFGGGSNRKTYYALETSGKKAVPHEIASVWPHSLEYRTDSGYDGMVYCYFTRDCLVTYAYQSEENGSRITKNMTDFYMQGHDQYADGKPFRFHYAGSNEGEPQAKSKTLAKGQYANPVCRLRLRSSPNLSAEKVATLEAGTLVRVVEVGAKATIDGATANWVKVETVNGGRFVEGGSADGAAYWAFGGYLE